MSYVAWLAQLRSAEKTSAIEGKVRKFHYQFPDGREMVEDYSTETGVVLRRAWKRKGELIKKEDWDIELGDPLPAALKANEFMLSESVNEPLLSKRLTRNAIEWRIRNLPFALATYTISCEGEQRTITIRTSNKKYFKRIVIPEFQRCNFAPRQEDLTVRHQNSTLIISYKKPPILLEMEKAVLVELQDVDTMQYDNLQCEDILKGLMSK